MLSYKRLFGASEARVLAFAWQCGARFGFWLGLREVFIVEVNHQAMAILTIVLEHQTFRPHRALEFERDAQLAIRWRTGPWPGRTWLTAETG